MSPSQHQRFDIQDAVAAFGDRLESAGTFPNLNRAKPMPNQELFFRSLDPNRILFGGNQSGKSWSGFLDDCLLLAKKHPHRQPLYGTGKLRVRVVGVDFERGIDQGAIPYFQQFLPPSVLIDGSWERSYRRAEHMLTLADGSTCSFMSYEQDPNKFQIVQLHHIHFDEEPPQAIFKESMPRLLRWNGTWTMTETPVQQLEWVQDDLMDKALPHITPEGEKRGTGENPTIRVFFLDTEDNTHLSVAKKAETLGNYSEEEKVIRRFGMYTSGSLVFPEFTTGYPHVIGEDFVPSGPDWKIYASMDHGYSTPSCWLWTAVHRDGSIVTFRCLYAAGVTVAEWCERVHAMNREIAELIGEDPQTWRPALYVGDPSIDQEGASKAVSGQTIRQAYAMHGVPISIEGIVATRSGNLNVGIDKMHEYLRARRPGLPPAASTGGFGEPLWQIVDVHCAPLIREMKKARKLKQTLKQRDEKNAPEDIRDKDNHAIDAIKYLFILVVNLVPEAVMSALVEFYDDLPTAISRAQHFAQERATPRRDRATFQSHNPWTLSGAGEYGDLEG